MGQPSYCCNSGHSCEWDDAGHVACCASGTSCQGSAYGAGAGAGAYQAPPSSTWYPQQQEQTTTVYQGCNNQCGNQGCNQCGNQACNQCGQQACNNPCPQPTPTYNAPAGGVVPIVPVTVATPLVPTTSYQQYVPTTTTTVVGGAAAAANNQACPTGYETLTQANVGAPVRTVGCFVIYDSGGVRGGRGGWGRGVLGWGLGVGGMLVVWLA